MNQEQMTTRKQKGYDIAKNSKITKTTKGWQVPSQTGQGAYTVISNGFEASCTCPDYETRKSKCKHVWAVELIVTKEVDTNGNVTITQTVRKTYSQDWKSYNLSQQVEKDQFMKLLAGITANIRNPAYSFGRPTNPLSDTIYSMIFKVYSGFSGRRFASDLSNAEQKNYVEKKVPYNSMFDYFGKKEITSLLADMVVLTSLPLRTVEKDFAIDSTGFATTNFQRWFSFKHGRELSTRRWVKCHFMTGTKSNIVSSVKITTEFDNDSPELPELVKTTAEHFDMKEVSADKAYLGKENLQTINDVGASPYIPFKSNSQPNGNGMLWKKLYHYFMLKNEEFMQHYHKRSNAETTVHMIKSKFGDRVRSKNWTAQVNEVLCKVICHNIVVVIHEMNELGISPSFALIQESTANITQEI
ncbi:transposase [Candidatus Woesearchaeota archaeon]|nr:transposase [Candidatus Woesearchaeota archaeon]